MSNEKTELTQLDLIIKNTINAINNSKEAIFEIAENARNECKLLEDELTELKLKVKETISRSEKLEIELKESKRLLMLYSKNFAQHSENEIKKAYEKADNYRIELAVQRELEKQYIKQRNKLELELKML